MSPTRAFSAGSLGARSAERASTGTMALVSAPPRTSSYSMLGTWLAVTYAPPRHVAPTVCENTSVRTRPSSRDSIVRPATMAAPRAMPAPSPDARPGLRRFGQLSAFGVVGQHLQLLTPAWEANVPSRRWQADS